MSNIGRTIVKELAVKSEGNETLRYTRFRRVRMLPRLTENETGKGKCCETRCYL